MATASSSANAQWADETRQAIGRPRRGAETRTEETALPDKAQLAIASRLTNLKDKIDELAPLAPESTMSVINMRYSVLQRSLLGGNAVTMESPLAQLETTVTQLLTQAKSKPKPKATAAAPATKGPAASATAATGPTASAAPATPPPPVQSGTPPAKPVPPGTAPLATGASPVAPGAPKRTPPPPPPRAPQPATAQSAAPGTPPATPATPPRPGAPATPVASATPPAPPGAVAPPPPAQLGTQLRDKIAKIDPVLVNIAPDGGAPAAALQVELAAIKVAAADPSKQDECLAKLDVLTPKVMALQKTVEASRLAAASAKVATLGAAPADNTSFTPVDTRAKAAIAAKTTELTALLKAGSENQDQDIHRDVLLGLTSSKDKSYVDNVQKPCDAALKAVADAVAAKKPVKPTLTKRLELLLTQLDGQRAHYADKTGITDNALIVQRDNKVAAIDKRKTALSAAIAKVAEIAKVQETAESGARDARRTQLKADGTYAAVMKLTGSISDMNAADPVAATKAVKDLQKYLAKADPVTRQVLFQDMKGVGPIAAVLKQTDTASADAIVADIIKAKSAKPQELDELSAQLIQSEIRPLDPVGGRGTALRSNSMASKLSGQYNKTSRSGQQFIDQSNKAAVNAIVATPADLEIDPKNLVGMSDAKKQQAIAERTVKQKEIARAALDGVTKTPVPADVAKICATIYDEAMAKFKTATGAGDEKQAMALVGGHLMLRLVTPGLATAMDDPSMTEDQKKTIKMQMKLLQNISNNVPPGGDKEPHMNGFADLVKTSAGGPSPEVLKLQAYLKGAVTEGKAANFDWGSAEAILNNDRARGILMEFVKSEYSDENLLFWEAVRAGAPANPQMVYDTYIAATADKQVNLPSAKRKPFDDINATAAPKDWSGAPWAVAKAEITSMIGADTLRRFKESPKAMDAARAAVG